VAITVEVPIWSVRYGTFWTLVAASTKEQAELLLVGMSVRYGVTFVEATYPQVRRATEGDVAILRSLATDGATEAAEILDRLGLAPPAETGGSGQFELFAS
jgi:hypothetical protein